MLLACLLAIARAARNLLGLRTAGLLARRDLLPLAAILPATCFALAPVLLWSLQGGLRIAWLSDPLIATVFPEERPLTAQTLQGAWALGAVMLWLLLAYRSRSIVRYEVALVLTASVVALPRLGNGWLFAILLAPALARQLWFALPTRRRAGPLTVALAVLDLVVLVATQAPPVSESALTTAAAQAPMHPVAFTTLSWAGSVQASAPMEHVILAGDATTLSTDQLMVYERTSLAVIGWDEWLKANDVSLLVVDAAREQAALAAAVREAPEWQVVYDSDGALVASRDRPT